MASFHWRLQANDRTSSYLELWFPKEFDPNGYIIELLDPSGGRAISFTIHVDPSKTELGHDPGLVSPLLNRRRKPVGQISVDLHRADKEGDKDKTGRWRVLIIMAPSEPENDRLPGIEAGNWTVVVKRGAHAIDPYPIHCWIQRDCGFRDAALGQPPELLRRSQGHSLHPRGRSPRGGHRRRFRSTFRQPERTCDRPFVADRRGVQARRRAALDARTSSARLAIAPRERPNGRRPRHGRRRRSRARRCPTAQGFWPGRLPQACAADRAPSCKAPAPPLRSLRASSRKRSSRPQMRTWRKRSTRTISRCLKASGRIQKRIRSRSGSARYALSHTGNPD